MVVMVHIQRSSFIAITAKQVKSNEINEIKFSWVLEISWIC